MSRAGIFETIIGVVVVAVAAAFLYYAYNLSGRDIERGGYALTAVFGKVDGVAVGAEVRIAGVKVGAVTGNELNNANLRGQRKAGHCLRGACARRFDRQNCFRRPLGRRPCGDRTRSFGRDAS